MTCDNVVPLRHPGQCCGLCRHIRETGDERRWCTHVCAAITAKDGKNGLPVVPESGTRCRYFRRRPSPPPSREP